MEMNCKLMEMLQSLLYANTSENSIGVSSITLCTNSRSIVDWVYGKLNLPVSYIVELPVGVIDSCCQLKILEKFYLKLLRE